MKPRATVELRVDDVPTVRIRQNADPSLEPSPQVTNCLMILPKHHLRVSANSFQPNQSLNRANKRMKKTRAEDWRISTTVWRYPEDEAKEAF